MIFLRSFLSVLVFFGLGSVAFGQWHAATKLPVAVPDARAVHISGQIYVLSGTVNKGLRRFFEAFDVRGDGWRPLTPLPVDIYDFSVASAQGRVFVSGGRNADGAYMNTMWVYTPDTALWVALDNMPQARAGHVSVWVDEMLYIFGGDSDASSNAADAHVLQYNLSTGLWRKLGRMPEHARDMALAVDGDKVILAGGRHRRQNDLRSVWAFDTKRVRWSRLPNLPHRVSGAALAKLSDGLHLVGGFSHMSQRVRAHHFILSPRGRSWKRADDLPQGRHRMGYATANDRLYVMGGAVGGGFYALFTASDQMHYFTLGDR